jgi:serine/threonine protein kinase
MSEREIFDTALAFSDPVERSAYLDRVCASDPALKDRIEGLLDVHGNLGNFLEAPACDLVATVDRPAVVERPGTIIGPYKLLEQIGEGGFGIVFMAEQQHPVRRQVAVKVLKPGMESRQIVARFEAERQALALMDHPNIAHVLDGGETASGRPYFVMDLVRGLPITEFCDRDHLTPRERLELFVSTCHAVQHAHQKGIIHRDIKPSNLLVTLDDGVPVVKIIDFGIAKAIGQRLTDKTLATNLAQLIGTPLYMSPEQAEMSGLDVDTRTDIYSLGVLLYELLTGTTPFDKERLHQASYDEIRRIVREEEPPKPSTRISTMGQAAASAVSAQRHSDPKQLRSLLRGDLDWIAMKALEKDRNRRYETAGALARDVERYLNDEPVDACPPSAWYRFRKLARRNRAALMVAGTISGTLCAAVVGLLIANYQVTAQRNLAQREHEQSEANLQKAQKAVDDYFTLVSESQLLDVPGLDSVRKRLLETALNYYEDFIRQHGANSQFQADVAAAHLRLAQITYLDGGGSDQYFPHLRDGVAIIERLIQEHRDTPEVQRRLAGLYLTGKELDISARGSVGLEEVIPQLEKLAHILTKFVADNPDVAELQNDLGGACRYVAQAYSTSAEAVPWFQKAIRLWEGLAGAHPGVAGYRENLARAYELFGTYLNMHRRRSEADQCIRKAFLLRQELVRDYPARTSYTAWLAVSYRALGESLSARKHPQEAEKNIRQALEIQQKLAGDFPSLHTYQHDLAQTRLALARLMKDVQRPKEAEADYRQALAGRQDLVAHFPKIALYRDQYVAAAPEVASFLASIGQAKDGAKITRQAALFCQERMQAPSLTVQERTEFGEVCGGLAEEMKLLGRADEAEELYERTIAIFEKMHIEVRADESQRTYVDRGHANLHQSRGDSYAAGGQWDKALADHARMVELEPSNHHHWFCSAVLYLYLGDAEGYRRICTGMLDRFGNTTDTTIAERTAKTCSLGPGAGTDPERVLKLADQAVTGKEKHRDYRWFVLARAMADYRAGHFTGAIDWLERLSPRIGGSHLDSAAFAVQALARHRLGRAQEARSALAHSQAILAAKMPNPKAGRPFANDWHDWLRALILCREAEGLLGANGAPAPVQRGSALD